VLDVEELDEVVVAREWNRLTNGMGTFKFHEDDPAVRAANIDAVALYITKSREWSPMPGTLTLAELYDLLGGIQGRQVLVEWNTGRRGRKRTGEENGKHSIRTIAEPGHQHDRF
jgi:hypothetical protein